MPRRLLLLFATIAVVAAVLPACASARGLSFGFDDGLFLSAEESVRQTWLDRAAETGASIARLDVRWSNIAPLKPAADFDAADPASAGYQWGILDAAVREADARGLRVLLTVYSAPRWAEGGDRPPKTEFGTWEPSADAFGEFASALATRYSGTYPDPSVPGSTLPRVRFFEAWNEPNLDTYLGPQWRGQENSGASIYRSLLDHFYSAIKVVQPGAIVLGGALAPFGDEPGGARTRPVLFLRNLVCLSGGQLTPLSCPEKARFDVLSDHPIAVGAPTKSATSPLDVTTPDLGRLTEVLQKAEKTNRVLPAGKKPLWVTEFWYDSNPPDPTGVPIDQQARWYEQDLYLFWRQGAEAAIALQIRDAPEGNSYASTYQSGAYFIDGSPKPAATAFRFPFVTHRTGPFKVGAWGIAPRAGQVRIQAYRDGIWKTLTTIVAKGPGHPFSGELKLFRFAKLRGVIGDQASLAWSQR
jgi:hypothetical protein